MSDQPNALRLAKLLDAMPSSGYALSNQAAAELRRLHEANQELLEALKQSMEALEYYADLTEEPSTASGASLIARAAIAKGEQA